MAVNGGGQLLECGHVGRFAGVCQYEGHGLRLCQDCIVTCDRCGRALCQEHQQWTAWSAETRVFCPDHLVPYYAERLLARLIPWGDGRGRI